MNEKYKNKYIKYKNKYFNLKINKQKTVGGDPGLIGVGIGVGLVSLVLFIYLMVNKKLNKPEEQEKNPLTPKQDLEFNEEKKNKETIEKPIVTVPHTTEPDKTQLETTDASANTDPNKTQLEITGPSLGKSIVSDPEPIVPTSKSVSKSEEKKNTEIEQIKEIINKINRNISELSNTNLSIIKEIEAIIKEIEAIKKINITNISNDKSSTSGGNGNKDSHLDYIFGFIFPNMRNKKKEDEEDEEEEDEEEEDEEEEELFYDAEEEELKYYEPDEKKLEEEVTKIKNEIEKTAPDIEKISNFIPLIKSLIRLIKGKIRNKLEIINKKIELHIKQKILFQYKILEEQEKIGLEGFINLPEEEKKIENEITKLHKNIYDLEKELQLPQISIKIEKDIKLKQKELEAAEAAEAEQKKAAEAAEKAKAAARKAQEEAEKAKAEAIEQVKQRIEAEEAEATQKAIEQVNKYMEAEEEKAKQEAIEKVEEFKANEKNADLELAELIQIGVADKTKTVNEDEINKKKEALKEAKEYRIKAEKEALKEVKEKTKIKQQEEAQRLAAAAAEANLEELAKIKAKQAALAEIEAQQAQEKVKEVKEDNLKLKIDILKKALKKHSENSVKIKQIIKNQLLNFINPTFHTVILEKIYTCYKITINEQEIRKFIENNNNTTEIINFIENNDIKEIDNILITYLICFISELGTVILNEMGNEVETLWEKKENNKLTLKKKIQNGGITYIIEKDELYELFDKSTYIDLRIPHNIDTLNNVTLIWKGQNNGWEVEAVEAPAAEPAAAPAVVQNEPIGILNIGNTCYFNSTVQALLNLEKEENSLFPEESLLGQIKIKMKQEMVNINNILTDLIRNHINTNLLFGESLHTQQDVGQLLNGFMNTSYGTMYMNTNKFNKETSVLLVNVGLNLEKKGIEKFEDKINPPVFGKFKEEYLKKFIEDINNTKDETEAEYNMDIGNFEQDRINKESFILSVDRSNRIHFGEEQEFDMTKIFNWINTSDKNQIRNFEGTNTKSKISKNILIGQPYLIIGVTRFNSQQERTINEIQNLKEILEEDELNYELKSIICHRGPTIYFGHYVCYLKKNNTWWLADDREIYKIGNWEALMGTEVKRNGYQFLYRKID